MSRISVPIIVVIIGEGCSGGALGTAVGDSIAMLEHSYYSVISPEGCASILWKDASKNSVAASALKLNAEELIERNIVDELIEEPLGGFHYDPEIVYSRIRHFIFSKWEELKTLPKEVLLEQRYQKFRKIGR
jgi:acetyl-CoA carboxylase carboxyl transferase subunit alpha